MSASEQDGPAKAPPRVFRVPEMTFQPRFAYGDQAESTEVCGTDQGTQLGAGFARFDKASIPWTIGYDEVLLVIEGRVAVRCNGEALEAGAGEAIWLPAGTELVYESEDALVFYAICPADWSDRAGTAGG